MNGTVSPQHQLSADEAGFTEYVALRQTALLRTAYLLSGDHQLAEDLVQNALLSAARHWRKIHTNPDPYVRRSLVNANISRWRRIKGREVPLEHTDRPLASHAEASDTKLALTAALDTLTTKQRALLVLRYYDDLTEAQAADALGISVGTVKSTTRQAFARLRERAPHLADLIGSTS